MDSETVIQCPSCGAKIKVTLTTLVPQESATASPKLVAAEPPRLQREPSKALIEWKPWKSGQGEWVNMLEALELFEAIQKAGSQLERNSYRYWIFGNNRDMIARRKIG